MIQILNKITFHRYVRKSPPILNPEIFLPLNTKTQEIDPHSISFLANEFLSDINSLTQSLLQVNDHFS